MWIVYILLYLLGVVVTIGIFGCLNIDLYYNSGAIFAALLWPIVFVLLFIFILMIVPYYIGKWVGEYKNQIDLKSYLKKTFSMK